MERAIAVMRRLGRRTASDYGPKGAGVIAALAPGRKSHLSCSFRSGNGKGNRSHFRACRAAEDNPLRNLLKKNSPEIAT
jgi:hypothetical protein